MNTASGQDANLTFHLCILYCRSLCIRTFPNYWKDSLPVNRDQIYERRITLRFLGVILRVLRLEISVWIS
jgi:hypothetical protein